MMATDVEICFAGPATVACFAVQGKIGGAFV
jgi:hypothetical protein